MIQGQLPTPASNLAERNGEGLINETNRSSTILHQNCGSKIPPFAQCADFSASSIHIYCGKRAIAEASEGYYYSLPKLPTAALALPWNKSPYEFDWPVSGRVCVVHSEGEMNKTVYEMGHALTLCGANTIYAIYNGELIIWKQSYEQRMAA